MFFDKVPFKNLHNTNRVCSIYLGFWLIVESSNRARYLCLWSFYRHYRGGGPLLNVFLRVQVLIFVNQTRVRSIFLEFL